MNKKSAPRAAAVIEIGSNNVRMRVSQWAKGTVATLDRLEYPVSLGHDVFSSGDISFDSLRELSSVLSKFTAALRSYNIEKPKVISCTALREAKNRALVVDQLKVRNGLEVTVLEDSQEKAYIYKEVMERLDGAKLHPGNTMIAYVGSGSIGVAVYDGQKIIYTQNISMGALKLHDVLRHLHHQEADDFYYIIEEYLDTILNRIAISRFQVKNLVLTGSQLELVAQLCEAKKAGIPYQISVKKLTSLYQSIRSATAESIANRFNITEERAALLYTSLSIYNGMLRFCPQAENVISPPVDISEAMLRYQLAPKADATLATYLRESALACAQTTAQSFGCNLEHSAHTGEIACQIFDKLKKVHGVDSSKRLILELASTLHSCGSFVNRAAAQPVHLRFDQGHGHLRPAPAGGAGNRLCGGEHLQQPDHRGKPRLCLAAHGGAHCHLQAGGHLPAGERAGQVPPAQAAGFENPPGGRPGAVQGEGGGKTRCWSAGPLRNRPSILKRCSGSPPSFPSNLT